MTLRRKQRCPLFHEKKAIFHLKNLRPALPARMESGARGKHCIIRFGQSKFKRWLWGWGEEASPSWEVKLFLQLGEEEMAL